MYDVVSANLKAIQKCDEFSGNTYNVGCGENFSINEIAKLVGGPSVYIQERPGEARQTLADIEDTIRDLDWKPNVKFSDGVEMMRKYYTEMYS